MNAIVILNEAAGTLQAGRDAATPAAIAEAFTAAGISVECRMAPPNQLEKTLQSAAQDRPDVIIVGGGDGTLNTAAHVIAGTGIPLGVLPLGTLNHFAADLGLPPDWRDAVTALVHGSVQSVDLGEVNGHTFINNCSIGSYADAVRKRDALRRRRGFGKWWAMTLATLTVFRRLRRIRLRIEANGNSFPVRTPFLVVANNRYSGHVLDRSLRPRLDEGRLWMYTTRARRHGDILRFAWQSLLREIDDVDGLDKIDVTDAIVNYDYGRLPVATDGEIVELQAPLRFRSRPGALRVLAPSRVADPQPAMEPTVAAAPLARS